MVPSDFLDWGGPVARRVVDIVPRSRVALAGTVVSVRAGQWRGVKSCMIELDDGTGLLDLVFTGRHRVPGLAPGSRCRVEGTALPEAGGWMLWNPQVYVEELPDLNAPGTQHAAEAFLVPGAVSEHGVPGSAEPDLVMPPAPGPAEPAPERPVVGAPGADVAAVRRSPDTMPVIDDVADVVAPAGQFRIYLGAAAGVGKTYAMLNEAQRRAQRGAEIVVGFAECHGRRHTEELLAGLEVIPRKQVAYRGTSFEEMDVDAILARNPAVVLVDELAHTNVPGSGAHEKRWQDVLQLLEAGIAVISTVNIQHLESLADAVERITGVAIRERVPDWVVRRADQLELVDSSPEQLRRRMIHGNIYPPEKVPDALTHFFRTENLVALRELALRFLADETEEELLAYLQRHAVSELWETTERMMVGVTGAPGSDGVMRRAARIASRIKCEMDVVHVTSGDAAVGSNQKQLEALRQLAEDLGGHWHELKGDDPVETLLEFARAQQTTQIVLGSSRRSRWEEMTKGSFLRRVIRAASIEDVDVHVIARRTPAQLESDPLANSG